MSDKDNNQNGGKDLSIPDHISKEKLKVIQETYDVYSSESIEVKHKSGKSPETKNEQVKTPVSKASKEHVNLITDDDDDNDEPESHKFKEMAKAKPVTKPANTGSKNAIRKIIFEINSLDDLNSNLQKNIKRLLNSSTKEELSRLIDEVEKDKDKFLKDSHIFGKISHSEKMTLEKKLAETEVAKEVTEVNISAILSCLDNLVID